MQREMTQPDVHSATALYANRFAGKVGAYLLSVQTNAILGMLGPMAGARVLDVGGGHGQVVAPLIEAGFDVTLLASEEAATEQAKRDVKGQLTCIFGDLCNPPVPARSFDAVVAMRMVSHVDDWEALIGGMCRAARSAVIVDFAIPGGSNALEPLLFGLKKSVEGDTRKFRMVSKADMKRVFSEHGFEIVESYGQFVLPMAVHRVLKSPTVSRAAELVLRTIGLATVIGTPIIAMARRIETPPDAVAP